MKIPQVTCTWNCDACKQRSSLMCLPAQRICYEQTVHWWRYYCTSIWTWTSIYNGGLDRRFPQGNKAMRCLFLLLHNIVRHGWHVWCGWCLRWETAAPGPAAAALRSDSWTLDTDTELQIVFLPQSGTASTDNEHPASQPRSGDFMNNQQFKRLKLIS